MNAPAGLTAADDSFHRPANVDPFWTETAWFGFSVPERHLTGALYPLFRPNQGVCSVGVYVWDDSSEHAHELLYARTWWHLPMPDHDLTELSLPNGLRYERVEPLHRYRMRYEDGDEIRLDLEFEAIHPPFAPLTGERGHVDQAGHVTGEVVLHGETIAVDCYELRDRSWSVRHDHGPVRAGYAYGVVGPDEAFLAMTMAEQGIVVAGYHFRGGALVPLTGGTRRVEYRAGRPDRVVLEATADDGGELRATGACLNRFAFLSSPNYFAWMSLTRWDLHGATAWGEDQDVFSPDLLRAHLRRHRVSALT